MKKQLGRGFTIIELIVVIAIIAVLAAIVLVNVTQYIGKGRDAAAEGNLATMLTNGAVFYDTNSTFTNFTPAGAAGAVTTIAAGTACAGNSGFATPCTAITSAAATGYAVNYACGLGTVNTASVACTTASVTNWCASITLKSGSTYCVDSTGNKKTSSTCVVTATSGVLPATCS